MSDARDLFGDKFDNVPGQMPLPEGGDADAELEDERGTAHETRATNPWPKRKQASEKIKEQEPKRSGPLTPAEVVKKRLGGSK